jgi:membrane fusion protein, multidrug efflux system
MTIRTTTYALGMTGVILLLGCHGSKSERENGQAKVQPLKVATVAIVERAVPRVVALSGTLTADQRADLTANASGRVARTFVERGQAVVRGTVLAQLDVRSAAASFAEAQAQEQGADIRLGAARAECARHDILADGGVISERAHDNQTAACKEQSSALAASRARLSAASLVLENGTIRAPFAGRITERFLSAGDYVQPASKVVTLVVSNPLRLKLTVPERRVGDVREGALVTFATASTPNRTFTGSVKYLSGEVRTTSRDMVVEAIVPNPDGVLLPGMFVDANLQVGERPVPVIPRSAVVTTGQDSSIFVVKDRLLVLRTLLLGANLGDLVAVEEGAVPGDVVVTNPTPAMFDGAPVE